MISGAESLYIHTPECRGVLRQVGTLGVIKESSVEVHELAAQGLARADPTELSSQLRFQTDRPIVLAYKYHTPKHALGVSVLRHEEVPVLKAVVDKAYYEALIVEDNTMHRVLMTLQTTGQMQYLTVTNVPDDATLWSVLVNSVAVKPSRGAKGALLLPLQARGTTNDGTLQATSIELVYTSAHPPLGKAGQLTLSVPSVDSPVTVLMAAVSIPSRLDVNYTSDLSAVSKFNTKLPTAVCLAKHKHMVEPDFDFSKGPILMDSDKIAGTSMEINLPSAAGQTQRFERLLVVNSSPEVRISYAEHVAVEPTIDEVPWWQSIWAS